MHLKSFQIVGSICSYFVVLAQFKRAEESEDHQLHDQLLNNFGNLTLQL